MSTLDEGDDPSIKIEAGKPLFVAEVSSRHCPITDPIPQMRSLRLMRNVIDNARIFPQFILQGRRILRNAVGGLPVLDMGSVMNIYPEAYANRKQSTHLI